jgi:hypothetical protein
MAFYPFLYDSAAVVETVSVVEVIRNCCFAGQLLERSHIWTVILNVVLDSVG